jgi:hypothetical protein
VQKSRQQNKVERKFFGSKSILWHKFCKSVLINFGFPVFLFFYNFVPALPTKEVKKETS